MQQPDAFKSCLARDSWWYPISKCSGLTAGAMLAGGGWWVGNAARMGLMQPWATLHLLCIYECPLSLCIKIDCVGTEPLQAW